MVKFPDLYTQVIYNYLTRHDGEFILLADIKQQYNISYPTIKKRIDWLHKNNYIRKFKRKIDIIPQF